MMTRAIGGPVERNAIAIAMSIRLRRNFFTAQGLHVLEETTNRVTLGRRRRPLQTPVEVPAGTSDGANPAGGVGLLK